MSRATRLANHIERTATGPPPSGFESRSTASTSSAARTKLSASSTKMRLPAGTPSSWAACVALVLWCIHLWLLLEDVVEVSGYAVSVCAEVGEFFFADVAETRQDFAVDGFLILENG